MGTIVYGKERDYIVHDDNNVKGFFGDYRWLSNFHECHVCFDNLMYTSTENAYQSAKCANLNDRIKFLGITAFKSMKLGREGVKVRKDWDDVKYDMMAAIVFDKFYRDLDLRHLLLQTGDKHLEETNHWNDTYWGVCEGVGQNNLGKILMKVRSFWSNNDKKIFN